jgi:hypothetical protein
VCCENYYLFFRTSQRSAQVSSSKYRPKTQLTRDAYGRLKHLIESTSGIWKSEELDDAADTFIMTIKSDNMKVCQFYLYNYTLS